MTGLIYKIRRNRKLMRVVLIVLVVGGSYLFNKFEQSLPSTNSSTNTNNNAIFSAIQNQQSDVLVESNGRIVKVLPDDNKGSRHQRFLVKLNNGHVILIAHNIDLAPRIDSIREGEEISFKGEFEWNNKGGVVHWTHHDPRKKHPGGWLHYKGQKYE